VASRRVVACVAAPEQPFFVYEYAGLLERAPGHVDCLGLNAMNDILALPETGQIQSFQGISGIVLTNPSSINKLVNSRRIVTSFYRRQQCQSVYSQYDL